MNSQVGDMFGRIAKGYDLLNHVLSLGIDIQWRKELAAAVSGPIILDLAAGTLDVSIALQKTLPQAKILAMDFCLPMLAQGRPKLARHPDNHISLCVGDAINLPLADNAVNAITIAFGIRNIPSRVEAFREMLRVLKPGGKLCVLEFGSASERIWYGFYNFYLTKILPGIGRILARDKAAYEYLARTIKEFPAADALALELAKAGFSEPGFRKLTGGIVCLHWGTKTGEADNQTG